MDIKGVISFVMTVICCTTDAFEIVTNRTFVANSAHVRSCVAHKYSSNTVISNAVLPQTEVSLARSLADIYIRRIALREYSRPKIKSDSSGRRHMLARDRSLTFPISLPDDFVILGMPYNDLQLKAVPYVVSNTNLEGVMRGVLLEYRMDGVFKFALYANLNTFSVSPDFYQDALCKIIVSRLGRYPFLEEENVRLQEEFVRKTAIPSGDKVADGQNSEGTGQGSRASF